MKIINLQAENFKRLKAVDITPGEGNTVVIGGRNAQGKSSVLDAIMATLAGKKGAKDLSRPIRDGETSAEVTVELEDLTVTRRWTAAGSTVTVSPRGSSSKLTSPQAVLDKLIGTLTFDPLAFAESDAKAQVATLIDLIGREQFAEIATARQAAYDERTEANRAVKSSEKTLEHFESRLPAARPKPFEEVNVADLVALERQVRRKVNLRAEWDDAEAQIAELRELQAQIVEQASQLPDGDADVLLARIDSAAEHNQLVRQFQQVDELKAPLEEARGRSDDLTHYIADLDKRRAELITKAKLPVEGLAFDDEGVTFNGVPFHQASAAERLKVSVGMAMALNPELKVICVRDASLLDDDSKRALAAMATEHDFQIWIEVVGTPANGVGVIIEDGMVQA
jgi:ABC-type cobalamin/Fe3+-siderophores transport system ATPase subunit